MEIPVTQLPPGDPRLVDAIVGQLKSKGIFDKFRKECLADVDTKPAFLNLRQRVDGQVKKFLDTQTWKTDLNKNQLRDGVRKNIQESGILDTGIDAIINQVVNPKIKPLILPLVEDTVYTFLQIEKPKREIQEYDGQLQPPHHEQKPFYAQHQPLMPPPYPPYSMYQEIPPPYYGGPEPAKHPPSYAVSPRRDIDESINDESSVSADSEISMDEKPALEEPKPDPHAPVVAASAPPAVPPQTSDILPMETDVISSGEDDILARASPESASCMNEDEKPVEKIEMTQENAVDSFDTARGETDAMATAVEKMSLQEDPPKKEVDNLDAEKEVVTGTAAPPPVPPCLPLFDSRSLDSISSNTSGLSFSPPSGTKSPPSLPHAPPEAQPPITETSSTCKSVEDLRSTQSTPLVDEKSPVRQPASASSSEENSKPWVPYTLPKDLTSAERITIATFATSFVGAPATVESARVVEGASPVSAEDSQGSLGNTTSSVDEGITMTTAPLKAEEEAAGKEANPCRSDKSEGEITTSTTATTSSSSSSNSSSAASTSSSSPENSSSRNSPGPRTFEKDHHKSETHHQPSKTSHRERSRDSGRDRYHHHHSQKSKDDRERRHSKEGERRKSSSKHDDHSSHRDKDKHHSRRDKDDDKDRDRHGKGHSYSSGGAANPILSSGKTSSGGDSGSKDKKERSTDKSSDHKSHSHSRSSSHAKSHSSSHTKTHSSSLSSHSKSHSSSSKSSSKTSNKSSHLKSDSKQEGKSSSRREEKTKSSSEVLHEKDSSSSALSDPKKPKEASKNATMATPSSHSKKLNPKVDKKPDVKSVSKTETSRLNSASTGADGHSKTPKAKKNDAFAEKKVTKVNVLKEDSTFGLHLSNDSKYTVLPKPNSSLTKVNEKRTPPCKIEESQTGPLKGKLILEGDEKAVKAPSQTTQGAAEKEGSKSDTVKTLDRKGTVTAQADKSISISTKSRGSDVSVKLGTRKVKNKEMKPPLKSGTRKLNRSIDRGEKSPKTRRTRVVVRKRRTNGILVSSSSSDSSSSDEDESSLPVLKKVTIPLFNLTDIALQSTNLTTKTIESTNLTTKTSESTNLTTKTSESTNLTTKTSDIGSGGSVANISPPVKRKQAGGVLSRSFVSESDDDSDSSISLSVKAVLKSLFEDDFGEVDLSNFEGFTPTVEPKTKKSTTPTMEPEMKKSTTPTVEPKTKKSTTPTVEPKTKKSLPPSNKVKKIVPVKTKPLKAKPMRKQPLQRLQQELVVVCDTGSDSSDMEMSVVKFCRNSSKSTTPLTPSSPVRPIVEQGDEGEEEAPLVKFVKSNDFEGFTDEGFEDSFTSGSGADQRLRDYLSRFISISGSPMHLDDFISLDSDEDDPYKEETDMACTVFSSRSRTSIASASGRSVIEEIAEAETEGRPLNENVPLCQNDSEPGAHALTASPSGPSCVKEKDPEENAPRLASPRKPEAEDLPQSPIPMADVVSEASPLEMVPPPLSLYEMDSRMPLKKRKLSGSFSPASSPAKVQRRMAPRSVGDESTPFVEDFISKDMIINTYSILTPEEDRTSSKDYEVDLSQRENSYSPLSPASDSSAEDIKSKLKINCTGVVNKRDCEELSACPEES